MKQEQTAELQVKLPDFQKVSINNIYYNLENEPVFPDLTHEEVNQIRNTIKSKKFRKQITKCQNIDVSEPSTKNSCFHPYSRSKPLQVQSKGFPVNIPIKHKSLLNVNAKEFR